MGEIADQWNVSWQWILLSWRRGDTDKVNCSYLLQYICSQICCSNSAGTFLLNTEYLQMYPCPWEIALKPLNFAKSSLPPEAAIPLLPEEIDPFMPEEHAVVSSEIDTLNGTADSPQDQILLHFFAFTLTLRFNSYLIPKISYKYNTEVVVHTSKEFHDFSIYMDKSGNMFGNRSWGYGVMVQGV